MKILDNKKGISLVEVMVAALIVAIITVAGFNVFSSVRSFQREREIRLTAVNLAVSQMEDLKETAKNNDIDHSDLVPPPPGTTKSCTLTTFPDGFSKDDVSYTVDERDFPDDPDPDGYNYKTITVTVTYKKGTRQVQLKGFIVE